MNSEVKKMFSISAHIYNGQSIGITFVRDLEQLKEFIGEKLWEHTQQVDDRLVLDFSKIGDDGREECEGNVMTDFYESKLPWIGQCFNEMYFEMKPAKFGDVIGCFDDD